MFMFPTHLLLLNGIEVQGRIWEMRREGVLNGPGFRSHVSFWLDAGATPTPRPPDAAEF